MEWFRFYHEVVDDPKVQRLTPVLFKHWINVLCLASRNSERGTVPSVSDLAFGLRLSEPKVRAICADLIAAELIERDGDQLRMHAWSKRQKRSDDVTPRVNKHRASNDFETLQETVEETLQETLPHVRVENRGEQNRTEEIDIPSNDGSKTRPKPLPANGPAQEIVKAFCEVAGLESPATYPKAVGQAGQMVKAGITASDVPSLYAFAAEWKGTADLGLMLSSIDRWRAKPVLNGTANHSGNPHLGSWRPGQGPAPHAAEDWEYLRRGEAPVWGSANGGIDHL